MHPDLLNSQKGNNNRVRCVTCCALPRASVGSSGCERDHAQAPGSRSGGEVLDAEAALGCARIHRTDARHGAGASSTTESRQWLLSCCLRGRCSHGALEAAPQRPGGAGAGLDGRQHTALRSSARCPAIGSLRQASCRSQQASAATTSEREARSYHAHHPRHPRTPAERARQWLQCCASHAQRCRQHISVTFSALSIDPRTSWLSSATVRGAV